MKYFKQRRINKLKIKIAGMTEQVRLLYQIVEVRHTGYDRSNLIRSSKKLEELKQKLSNLHNK
jgi:hypothetical protein